MRLSALLKKRSESVLRPRRHSLPQSQLAKKQRKLSSLRKLSRRRRRKQRRQLHKLRRKD